MVTLLLLFLTAALTAATWADPPPGKQANVDSADWLELEHVSRHMGTVFRFTVYALDERSAERAIQAAETRIDELDAKLSDYRSDSELNRLAAAAPHDQPVPVSDDLFRVLSAGNRISKASDGAFDLTIGPLSRLWRRARRRGRWPAAGDLADAHQAVGYQHLQLDAERQTAQLTRRGMRLDAGAIAKGDALDQALQVFRDHEISRVLIDGGGDIVVGDPPPGKDGWTVAIDGFSSDATNREQIQLCNQAVATSGDRWQSIRRDGVRYSHIIDPRTGKGVTQRRSATVVADHGICADGWASALSVLGPERIELVARETTAARLLYRESSVESKESDDDDRSLRRCVSSRWHDLTHDAP